ncbi:MAG: hypothetical protein ACRBCK_08295 [Alphaproteobacteria bacterium]
MIILRPVWRGIRFIVQFIGLYILNFIYLSIAGAIAAPIAMLLFLFPQFLYFIIINISKLSLLNSFGAVLDSFGAVPFVLLLIMSAALVAASPFFLVLASPFLCVLKFFRFSQQKMRRVRGVGLVFLALIYTFIADPLSDLIGNDVVSKIVSLGTERSGWNGMTLFFPFTAFVGVLVMHYGSDYVMRVWNEVDMDEERELGV